MLLYIATYIFAIWDSYRTTIDLNKTYKLAAWEDATISTFEISSLEINYLDKRSPFNAFLWSSLMPGLGQVYIHRILGAFFIFLWWITICYYSKLVPAVYHSLLGEFAQAKAILDIQWLMNLPSVYGFAIYDAYINTVENNKLFEWELSKFLKERYQSSVFKMPATKHIKEGDSMYIISTFQYNQYLELALTPLQMKGIIQEKIMVAPLDKRGEERKLFDSIHHSDGLSLLDLGAILGTIFMLLGSIYGFILTWGPIWWALIGLFFGFGLGFIIKLVTTKKYTKNRMKTQETSEVVVIIECEKSQMEMIQKLLWDHYALAVSKLDIDHQPIDV